MNTSENDPDGHYDFPEMTEHHSDRASSYANANNVNSTQPQLVSSEQALLAILGGGLQSITPNSVNQNAYSRSTYRTDGGLNSQPVSSLNNQWGNYNPAFLPSRYDSSFHPYTISQAANQPFPQHLLGNSNAGVAQQSGMRTIGLPPTVGSSFPQQKSSTYENFFDANSPSSQQFPSTYPSRSQNPLSSSGDGSTAIHAGPIQHQNSNAFSNYPYPLDASHLSSQQLLSMYRDQVSHGVTPSTFRNHESFMPTQLVSATELSKSVDNAVLPIPPTTAPAVVSPPASSFPLMSSAATSGNISSPALFDSELGARPEGSVAIEPSRVLLQWSSQSSSHTIPSAGASIPTSSLKSFFEHAAEAARKCNLDPRALESFEQHMLSDRLHDPVVLFHYFQIRNSICWLWIKNPTHAISRVEAQGVCVDRCLFQLASLAYEFLVRYGYINYGCLSFDSSFTNETNTGTTSSSASKQKTIAVVGAGLTGLICARQLTGLFSQYSSSFLSKNELPPKVIILEAKERTGGRIYSRALPVSHTSATQINHHTSNSNSISSNSTSLNPKDVTDPSHIPSAIDLGFQFLFSPMDDILLNLLNKQLGIEVTEMTGSDLVYDETDTKVLDMVEVKKLNILWEKLLEYVSVCFFINVEESVRISWISQFQLFIDEMFPDHLSKSLSLNASHEFSFKKTMLILIDEVSSYAKLGNSQKKFLIWCFKVAELDDTLYPLNTVDTDFSKDILIPKVARRGLSQLPWALQSYPSPLNIHYEKFVSKVTIENDKCTLDCKDNSSYEVDQVVIACSPSHFSSNIEFSPGLPNFVTENIKSIDFKPGKKVILRYAAAFWRKNIRSFGIIPKSLSQEMNNDENDGKSCFVLRIWNMLPETGVPILVADINPQMTSSSSNETSHLIQELHSLIVDHFQNDSNSSADLLDAWVTNWSRNGVYDGLNSYPNFANDKQQYEKRFRQSQLSYNLGRLHIAGDYIFSCVGCRTLQRSFLSGLSVCTGIIDSLAPISLTIPIIGETSRKELDQFLRNSKVNNFDPNAEAQRHLSYQARYRLKKQERLDEHKEEQEQLVTELLGYLPEPPSKPNANPFLLYQKMQWHVCRALADEDKRRLTGDSTAKATINETRAKLGKTWRQLDDLGKKPWIDEIAAQREAYAGKILRYQRLTKEYEMRAEQIRNDYAAKCQDEPIPDDEARLFMQAQREEEQRKQTQDDNISKSREASDEEYHDDGSSDSGYNGTRY
ncbi:histone demethylase SWIRM2 [Schizosaccharomyces pombe]|uniref:Lysine-specific histone demethylase 2 n=1 Tax=Schizosaccharomyces pombe (strain 972 / ATCC 24843) TaxID=284812 RepID=LSD2_SCHPO